MCKSEVKREIVGWSAALMDAERQLRKAKGEGLRGRLAEIIRIIKRKIEAGEPWPGSG